MLKNPLVFREELSKPEKQTKKFVIFTAVKHNEILLANLIGKFPLKQI